MCVCVCVYTYIYIHTHNIYLRTYHTHDLNTARVARVCSVCVFCIVCMTEYGVREVECVCACVKWGAVWISCELMHAVSQTYRVTAKTMTDAESHNVGRD